MFLRRKNGGGGGGGRIFFFPNVHRLVEKPGLRMGFSPYRPSPVKLSPPKNRYFAPTDNFKAGTISRESRGQPLLSLLHTKTATPLQYEKLSPPSLFPPGGTISRGSEGGTISRGRVGKKNKSTFHEVSNVQVPPKKKTLPQVQSSVPFLIQA